MSTSWMSTGCEVVKTLVNSVAQWRISPDCLASSIKVNVRSKKLTYLFKQYGERFSQHWRERFVIPI